MAPNCTKLPPNLVVYFAPPATFLDLSVLFTLGKIESIARIAYRINTRAHRYSPNIQSANRYGMTVKNLHFGFMKLPSTRSTAIKLGRNIDKRLWTYSAECAARTSQHFAISRRDFNVPFRPTINAVSCDSDEARLL